MVMALPTYFTADMVRDLPNDGNRYEVVHGELLVTPSPVAPHQWVVAEVSGRLYAYLGRERVGRVFTSPADISWGPDTLVQPDVFVVELTQVLTLDWTKMRTLLLAVEVLSPSSKRADRFTKRRVYQEAGVATYWVVDLEARAIEVWTPDAKFPVIERERVTWRPAGADTGLTMPLSEILPPA